ncbi:protein Son isoform X2 [Coccinella septempunctata]|uniref:protein Son isoform X2 n=1 Tax=Coccinella septempunctata TaxID=41139 RepID=UPI001D05F850|nr:protein Son isoform X2 [Coccinella septempunctata]
MEIDVKTEEGEKEEKPIVETKSSLEILSELFSTFDADPPVLIEDELSNGSKKPKKKKKHKSKDKKHKKKSKKRKRSRSRSSSSSSSELEFDLAKLLVKQDESAEKRIKIEGTELSLSLDKINEKEPEEDIDVKPHIAELAKGKENEEGEISCDDDHSEHKKHKSKHKHKKRKSKDKIEKHAEKSSDDISNSKHRHRSSSRHKSAKEKDAVDEFYKNKDDSRNDRNRSRSPHKHTDLRHKIKENAHKYSSDSHKDDKEYCDARYKADYKSNKHSRYSHIHDDDFYRGRDRDRSYDRTNKDDFYGRGSFDRNRDDRWKRSRDDSRENKYRDRRYSPDKDSSYIDKKKLLEIARKNAIQMMKSGNLPGALSLGPQAQEKVIAAIRAGGKTIEELTDFCKTLATKEDLGELSDVENDKGSGDSDNDKLFNHPFQIKDRPTTITMNIKNSVPLPIKSTQERTTELRMQFPVSSGQHHRKNENEWIPVEPKKDVAPPAPKPSIVLTKEVVPITPLVPPANSAPFLSTVPVPAPVSSAVPTQQQIDIGAIVSQRLTAMRKLQENPHDVQAISQIYQSTKEVQSWAESKQQPGQFTGTVGGNFLSHSELSSGYQAWARKASRDSLLSQGFKRKAFTVDVVDFGSTPMCRPCVWWHGHAFAAKNGVEAG